MQAISSKKKLMYYVVMYRRVVNLIMVLSIMSIILSLALIYFYLIQPDRAFYASATSYNITRLMPLN